MLPAMEDEIAVVFIFSMYLFAVELMLCSGALWNIGRWEIQT